MKDSILFSMAIGIMIGALIVSNNDKAQQMIEKGKSAVKKQVQKMTK